MSRTLSEEMDLWLEMQEAKNTCGRGITVPVKATAMPLDVEPCPITDAELDWLWPRLVRCRFGMNTWANSFAGTAREKLTPRGKNAAVKLAFKHRRQIFRKGDKLAWDEFLSAIRYAAAKNFSAGEPKHAAREVESSASTAPISPGEECPGVSNEAPASAGNSADAGAHIQ